MTARWSTLLALLMAAPWAAAQAKPPAKPKKPAKAAHGGKLELRVVDVAGGRAYLEPGSLAGLRAGDAVEVGGYKYAVAAVSPSSAAIELGKFPVERGAKGTAAVDPARAPAAVAPLARPAPLAEFRGLWPAAVLPASQQRPTPIALGPVTRDERSRASLSAVGYGVVPTSGSAQSFAHAELRGLLHYEPFVEAPLALDADLAAGAWIGAGFDGRAGSDSRPVIRVRTLQTGYGSEAAFLAALGRLHHASATSGSLDGLKLRAPLVGGLQIGGFGGIVANPLSGEPSTRASRFGGELVWEDAQAAWRPRAVLGGQVSRFDGRVDERRMTAVVDVNPSFGRIGAYGEANFFDRDNPWGAEQSELTAAGLDAAFRAGVVEIGGRASLQRPEKSRWLASLLPPEWLCIRRTTAVVPEACLGNDATYAGGLDAGLRFEKSSVTVGATGSRTENTDAQQVGGFGHVRLLDVVGPLRLEGGVMGSKGTLLETAALTISPGMPFLDGAADALVRYRPAVVRYQASTGPFVEHAVGGALWLAPSASFDVSLDADYVTGGDFDALLVQTAMVWRTGF